MPENASPFTGRPVAPRRAAKPKPAATPSPLAAKPVAKPGAKPVAEAEARSPRRAAGKPAARKPAFAVAGAPAGATRRDRAARVRAKQLAPWLESHKQPTARAVDHWLYQHNWIVTGAGFGWSGGADALRTLIAVDERVQKLWGVGGKSEQVARRALAEVEARSR